SGREVASGVVGAHVQASWASHNAGVTFIFSLRRESSTFNPMAIKVGSKAPDFTLKTKTADGLADVKLSDNLGKKNTVLFFFPLAFTSVCQDEMCSISNGLNEYKQLDAAVYGISVDSPFSQEAFAQQANIKVPLLSDFNKTVSRDYDVLFQDLM